MKAKVGKLVAGIIALAWVLLWAQPPLLADELQPAQPPSEQKLPGDLVPEQTPAGQNQSVPYQEYRVGGRLERVTVTRENGFTEIYHNNRTDTVWSAQENELGEVPNMRQWVIRTW